MKKVLNWDEIEIGGNIPEPGTSKDYETGSWRTFKPIWDGDKCTHCMFCWIYCPDNAIIVEDEKVQGIDYFHCKGCGLCAAVCPPKTHAIDMVLEKK